MHLGTLIARFREEERMSMDEFASRSGLSKAYISMLERNVNSRSGKPIVPSLETIKAVSGAIGVDFNAVISIIDPALGTKPEPLSHKRCGGFLFLLYNHALSGLGSILGSILFQQKKPPDLSQGAHIDTGA